MTDDQYREWIHQEVESGRMAPYEGEYQLRRIDTERPHAEYACAKCGQPVVKQGWFWVLPSEVGTGRATFCPEGDNHKVEEEES